VKIRVIGIDFFTKASVGNENINSWDKRKAG